MEITITEVRIFLKDSNDRKLKAYATITIDNAFVVRNVKIIEGNKGLFVAMPSRKIKESCPKCGFKNTVRSKFCNQCGTALPPPKRVEAVDTETRQSEHKDIAHPISLECREYIQKKVLDAYSVEKKKPGSGARVRPEFTRPEAPRTAPIEEKQPEKPEEPEGDLSL